MLFTIKPKIYLVITKCSKSELQMCEQQLHRNFKNADMFRKSIPPVYNLINLTIFQLNYLYLILYTPLDENTTTNNKINSLYNRIVLLVADAEDT